MNPSAALVLCLILLSLSGTQGKERPVRRTTELTSKHSVALSLVCAYKKRGKQAGIPPACRLGLVLVGQRKIE